jgi:hypothetical protein
MALGWNILVFFEAIWYFNSCYGIFLWPFGIVWSFGIAFYGHFGIFIAILVYFSDFTEHNNKENCQNKSAK